MLITTELQIALSLVPPVGMLLIIFGLFRAAERRRALQGRLSAVLDGPDMVGVATRHREPIQGAESKAAPPSGIEVDLAATAFGRRVLSELASAGMDMPIMRFLLLQAVLAALIVVGVVSVTQNLVLAVAGVAGIYLPWWRVRSQQQARREMFNLQLADAVSLLVSSLRAGQSLGQSIERVGRDSLEPTAGEFRKVDQEVKLGLPIRAALKNLASRVRSRDADLLVTALEVHSDVGGDIVQLMESMGDVMRVRYRLKSEIQVVTSQQRMAAKVLLGMPIFIALLLLVLNPKYMLQLFSPEPLLFGLPVYVLALTAALLLLVGYFAIRKAADVEL